jgi:hypothetical protein
LLRNALIDDCDAATAEEIEVEIEVVIGLIEDDCTEEGIFTLKFVWCDVLVFSFSKLLI